MMPMTIKAFTMNLPRNASRLIPAPQQTSLTGIDIRVDGSLKVTAAKDVAVVGLEKVPLED